MKKELIVCLKDIAQYFKDSLVISTISSLASFISSVGVIVGAYLYVSTSSDRQSARDLSLWANLGGDNTGKKYALQLFANDDVAMNSIVIKNVDLSGVVIPNVKMTYSNICGSNFTNSNLRNIDFSGATLDDNDFSYADLTGANLEDLNESNTQAVNTSGNYLDSCRNGPMAVNSPYFTGPANNNISGAILPESLINTLEIEETSTSKDIFHYLFCVEHRNDTAWEKKYKRKYSRYPEGETKDNQDRYIVWPTNGIRPIEFYWPGHVTPICNPLKGDQAICVSSWCARKEPHRVGRDIFYGLTVYSQPQYDTSASPDTGVTPK